MARPTKNNAEYFSHDAGMRNDPKIRALRKRFPASSGACGYSIYNMLLEVLTDAEFFSVEVDEIQLELLAGDFDTDVEMLSKIIEFCVKIKLFSQESTTISSCGLNKRLQGVIDKRNRSKEKFEKQKIEKTNVSVAETTQSKVKYSKVKESKDNYSHNYPSTTATAVGEEAAAVVDFSKKNEVEKNGNLNEEKTAAEFSEQTEFSENVPLEFPEEEFISAWQGLRTSGTMTLIRMQQEKDEGVLEKYFRVFYEQKYFGDEMKQYRTKDQFFKNFYFWIPKYKLSLKQNTKTDTKNGNSNLARKQSGGSSNDAEQRRAERGNLNSLASAVLLGAQAKQ